jgi:hypothetical protein
MLKTTDQSKLVSPNTLSFFFFCILNHPLLRLAIKVVAPDEIQLRLSCPKRIKVVDLTLNCN